MSSIGEFADASANEEEWGGARDGERIFLLPSGVVVVASANPGNRPVLARVSVMAAAEALLAYGRCARTDNERIYLWYRMRSAVLY